MSRTDGGTASYCLGIIAMLRTMQSERDRLLLREEIERLKRLRYSFQGDTEEERLGVDRWILGVMIVEERQTVKNRKGKKGGRT